MSRTEISQLGEFGLIDRINSHTSIRNPSTKKGIGDDAAVIQVEPGNVTLVSTDMLVEGIHFDLAYFPLQHLGYKSVAVNVSDIAAMNGQAKQITMSIGLSNRFSLEAVEELYKGINQACEDYGVDLVGGDTSASRSGLILSVTALGIAKPEEVVYRNGAKPNDIICVTGDLGASYLGLQIMEREKEVFLANPDMQPDLEKYDYLVGRLLKPKARTDVVSELKDLGIVPTSMIDISDGLASELMHISTQSNVGVRIYEANIPIDQQTYNTAVEFSIDPITCALNGGEDYELLFTLAKDHHEKIKNHPDIHIIGYVHDRPDQSVLITKQENIVPLRAQGWNHFSKP